MVIQERQMMPAGEWSAVSGQTEIAGTDDSEMMDEEEDLIPVPTTSTSTPARNPANSVGGMIADAVDPIVESGATPT